MKTPPDNPLSGTLARMRRALYAIGLFSFAINLFALTVPLHMLHIYDNVLPSRNGATLFFLTLLAIGFIAALSLLELFRSRF